MAVIIVLGWGRGLVFLEVWDTGDDGRTLSPRSRRRGGVFMTQLAGQGLLL